MAHYIRVYTTLLHMNFSLLLAYRGNFINSLISSLGWAIFSIVMVYLLTERAPVVYGWTRNDFFIFTGVYNVFVGIFHLLFSRNFGRFSEVIHFGYLDSLLIKPIDSQFLLSFWHIDYTSIFRIILGGVFTAYMLSLNNTPITFSLFILFLFLGCISLILLYSIWYIMVTLMIWFTNLSNLTGLLYDITSLARYPQDIFQKAPTVLFVILFPLTLVITLPVNVLLHRGSMQHIVFFVFISFALFVISRIFWQFALRFYTSASS